MVEGFNNSLILFNLIPPFEGCECSFIPLNDDNILSLSSKFPPITSICISCLFSSSSCLIHLSGVRDRSDVLGISFANLTTPQLLLLEMKEEVVVKDDEGLNKLTPLEFMIFGCSRLLLQLNGPGIIG